MAKIYFFLPYQANLKILYYLYTGEILSLENPKTFQEKIQWLKLHDFRPEYTNLVDKYRVKEFVQQKIGEQYIIKTLGVWDKFEEIDFNTLPNKFVLKTTHAGGSEGVVICKDKCQFNYTSAKIRLTKSLKKDYTLLMERPYKNVQRRILAEELLEMSNEKDVVDYKIFCFNGKAKYIQVIGNRHDGETIDFFDTNWIHQNFLGLNPNATNSKVEIPKPSRLSEMLHIAEILSEDFCFIRVDLYQIEEKVYFGELTFYPYSGYGTFSPKEWNFKIGQMLNLTKKAY